jgi:sacsin
LPKNQIKGKRKPGVKLELSKLRNARPDQLNPFEGLWDYTKDLGYYPGTIFRFPLRQKDTQSKLKQSQEDLDGHTVQSLMNKYFDEARISLLFLRRICSIDFEIHGKPNSGWSVSRQPPEDEDYKSFYEWRTCSFAKNMDLGAKISGTDKWWVAIEDLQPETKHLPYSPSRLMKNVECGIAALAFSKSNSSKHGITPPEVIQPRMFSTLPLPVSSDLPIYIHATFSLSGDRQSLIIDEHGQETYGSAWNRYLLENALPKLYLSCLDVLGGSVRQEVFNFWPREQPPKKSCAELLYSSFWKELPKSSGRFFPKAQLSPFSRRRQAPELFDLNQAVFDFLPELQSDILAPLLLSLGVQLVRCIPEGIAKRLKALAVKSVTGPMLRELFKSEEGKLRLQEEVQKNPKILEALLDQVIPAQDDFGDLDGCGFLPLADGTLGTLKLLCSLSTAPKYYMASAKEIKLFDFASGLLVPMGTGKSFEKVAKSGKFNIEKLQISHVKKLLEKNLPIRAVDEQTNAWLTEFWTFWNKSPKSDSELNFNFDGFAVFQATCNSGSVMCVEASQLEELPAVVVPLNNQHQTLCEKIPGLYRFNNIFMPNSLKENEDSFTRARLSIGSLRRYEHLR